MTRTFGYRAQLGLKFAFVAVCVVVAIRGHNPPAHAQEPSRLQYVPVITAKDAVQDEQINQINQHLKNTDDSVKRQEDAINANVLAISGFQVEERIIGSVLGLLSSAGLFIQIRKKAE